MTYKKDNFARKSRVFRLLAGVTLVVSLAFLGASSAVGAPPGNDNLASATTMTGASGSDSGTTVEATAEGGEDDTLLRAGVTTTQTVWWKWTAPTTAQVTFGVASSTSTPTIAVWTGTAHPLAEESSDADTARGLESRVFVNADAGTTYYIQVGALQTTAPGAFTITWGPSTPENDDFAKASELTGARGSIAGWNVAASKEPGEPPAGCCLGSSVWYAWKPAADGRADLTMIQDFSISELNVYTGSTLPELVRVAQGGASSTFGGSLSFDA